MSGWRARAGLVLGVAVAAWAAGVGAAPQERVLRLATTTSTADTGLLGAILPAFEQAQRCRVHVVAVGTGQALEIARRGDADVVLVHARQAEDQFIAERHARGRRDVMYNDFVLVGPAADPARISGLPRAAEALAAVARAGATFVSRGDRSGTHTAELALWRGLGIDPAARPWYRSVGQGMGETLVFANEQLGYTISDRGTWLSMRQKLPGLALLVGGRTLAENKDPGLLNRYGVLVVNPDTHPGVNDELGSRFAEWLVSVETQRVIGQFGVQRFGQPLYYPDSAEWRAAAGRGPAR